MTKKNKAAINKLEIKSAEDLQIYDDKPAKCTPKNYSSDTSEKPAKSTAIYACDTKEHSSLFRSKKKKAEAAVIETQPKPKEYVKSAIAVDRGLTLSFFPLTNQMAQYGFSSLEILKPITTVVISQIVDMDDTTTSINQYLIKNDKDEELFFAVEHSKWFERVLFGPSRTFTISITDCNHQLVIKIRRQASCSMCIPPLQQACLCFNRIFVSAPPGIYAGSVNSSWTFFRTSFDVRDDNDDVVYRIKGKRVKFDIYNTDDEVVGCIQPGGNSDPVRAMYAEYQHITVQFPQDASIRMKAVLIGAVFLIDYLFFDKEKKSKDTKYDGIQRATIIGV